MNEEKKKFGEDVDKEKVKAEITPLYTPVKLNLNLITLDQMHLSLELCQLVEKENIILIKIIVFKKIWMNPRSNEFMRESLKLVIAAIGDEYVGAVEDGKRWYNYEMVEWSRNLNNSSDQFIEKFNLDRKEDDELAN